MRKWMLFLLIFFLITLSEPIYSANLPQIGAEAYILIDGDNGQVLLEKDAQKRLNPASTTKIMTAIVALEKGQLEDEVIIGKNVPLVQGTKVYLREGEKLTLDQLLHGMLIHSANDAALAIAEHIGGSQEKFAALMNSKARQIGALDANFVNPHGLTAEDHLCTAADLALISQYALNNETFRNIVQKKTYDWEGQEWQTRLINKNKMLWEMETATGVKNGYTDTAHYTLVASAQEKDQELIAVILGCSNKNNLWDNAQKLLEFGFKNFQNHTLAEKEQIIATVKLENGQTVDLGPVNSGKINLGIDEEVKLDKSLQLDALKVPIKKGDILGQLIVSLDDQEIATIPLEALNEVKRKINWLQWGLNFLAGLFMVQVIAKSSRSIFKKRRRNVYPSGISRY